MEIEPAATISAAFGGYIVKAWTRLEPEADEWGESVHVFSRLTDALVFMGEAVEDYESRRDETAKVEDAMRRKR